MVSGSMSRMQNFSISSLKSENEVRVNTNCQNGSGRTRKCSKLGWGNDELTYSSKSLVYATSSLTQDVLCEQIWVVLFVAQAKLFQTGIHCWLELALTVLVNRAKSIPNAFGRRTVPWWGKITSRVRPSHDVPWLRYYLLTSYWPKFDNVNMNMAQGF